ncbi:DUF4831 family protein [Carboxylicivirga sp. N1Y90]|uniref:DUF4831 family protein n=1 Tax=Carboxylicivirga fragile TaxID=3417571 RepID=UPI003D328D0E|nr:DUF4831 family protein [Marinilabiliaceae bacterium N1Y90]
MRKVFLYICLGIVVASCAVEQTIPSKVNVKEVSKLSNASVNSLVYALPSTKIRVEVSVEKTISKVGPFYRYSQKMLNVTDVVTKDDEKWAIKDINLSTFGVADLDKQYAISYSGESVAPLLNVNNEGVLVGVNLSDLPKESCTLKSYNVQEVPSVSDINFNAVPMMEKQLAKTSTAAMAEEAANFIYKIRKRRFKILASDYENLPPDGKSYEVTVRELDALEEAYLELFIGKVEKVELNYTYDIHPNALSANNDVLFRFSTVQGVVDKMDMSGAPVYIEIDAEEKELLPDAPLPITKEEVRTGLYYCRPGKATVKIIDRNKLLRSQEVYLGQYGQVVNMPSSVLEEKNISIQLDSKTGALKSIERK